MKLLICFSIYIFIMNQILASGISGLKLRKIKYYLLNILCPIFFIMILFLFFALFYCMSVIYDFNVYLFSDFMLFFVKFVFITCVILFYILGISFYYVHEFRGTNLNFSDILSINTAKEVAGGYKFKIKISFLFFLLLNILITIILFNDDLSYTYDFSRDIFDGFFYTLLLFSSIFNFNEFGLLLFLFPLLAIFWIFLSPYLILRFFISNEEFDYSIMAGENQGYLYNFFSSIPIFHKKYKNKKIQKQVVENFIRNENKKLTKIDFSNYDYPHVIVIMNESFGSIYENIKTNKRVCEYYESLKNVAKGNLYVNTFGGGTANTEFEFLTCNTIGNMKYPIMPYNNYVKNNKYSIARYFNNLNYNTTAMHPYTNTNYHRDKVYKFFGFNELYFYDDFKNRDTIRNYVSDESMYKEVIDKYENNKQKNLKSFIFGITMQNHGGYGEFSDGEIKSINDNEISVDTYLSLQYLSDKAIKILIDYFNKEKDRVIICFFGDHNPSFNTKINKKYFDIDLNYTFSNVYKTPLFIYDNKNKKSNDLGDISANFLASKILEIANLPFDVINKYNYSLHKNISCFNFFDAKLKDGKTIKISNLMEYSYLQKEFLGL